MNGGMSGVDWMGGSGGILGPILLIIVVVGLAVWAKKKRK